MGIWETWVAVVWSAALAVHLRCCLSDLDAIFYNMLMPVEIGENDWLVLSSVWLILLSGGF